MSEPSQPPVPSESLPAAPQYPAAQQHPAAPHYQGQHVPPTHQVRPHPTQQPAPAAASGRAGGRIALVIAAATFALNVVVQFLTPLLYRSLDGFETVGAISGVLGVLSLIAYAAALVLALLALRTSGPRLTAGIALGIAGTGVISILVSFVATFLYRFL